MKTEMYKHIHEVESAHWWYVARRKIVFDWVFRVLADYSGSRVLDVGCGTGFNVEYLRTYGYSQVTGLDFSTEALKFCQARNLPHLVCGDGIHPPFRHASFDMIMALDLIEHLDDDTRALREFARLLRPGGSIIIFAPAFNFLWGLQDEVSHHHRRYTASELRQKLEAAGLSIRKLTYANMFLLPLIWAGRIVLRLIGNDIRGTSENDLNPDWSNGLLQAIFSAERPLLRYVNF
ncbi:MAG TPA: class I SAM-dependent methyltransferase, partial [Chloroflexi bacterium]|nr:class I SAM-dependent methyltransferase [Chloroflexota bacterium]